MSDEIPDSLKPFDRENPGDVRLELAKLRYFISQVPDSNPGLAKNLIDSTVKAADKFTRDEIRSHNLLSRAAIQRFALAWGQVILDELTAIEDADLREKITDNIVDRVAESLATIENESDEIKRLQKPSES